MKIVYFIMVMMVALCVGSPADALPRNFRNVDTFFVGAMPDEDDIEEFKTLGIETILSLHELPPEVRRRAKQEGMTVYSFPMRTTLRNIDAIMEVMQSVPPHSLYLHCKHGADRTGAVTAYWLYFVRSINPYIALESVLSPSQYHYDGLRQLGKEHGVCIDEQRPPWIGKYSGARNGGLEGLKVVGDQWYTKLARNFLDITIGQWELNKKDKQRSENYWDKYNKRRDKNKKYQ